MRNHVPYGFSQRPLYVPCTSPVRPLYVPVQFFTIELCLSLNGYGLMHVETAQLVAKLKYAFLTSACHE